MNQNINNFNQTNMNNSNTQNTTQNQTPINTGIQNITQNQVYNAEIQNTATYQNQNISSFQNPNYNINQNNIPPKKKNNSILIIGIAIILMIILVVVGILLSNKNNSKENNNSNNSNNKSQSIQFTPYDSSDEYVIEKINIEDKDYIVTEAGQSLATVDENGNIIKDVITDPDYKFHIENRNYDYYFISLNYQTLKIDNNINIENNNYTYDFKIYWRIINPLRLTNKIKIQNYKTTDCFQDLFGDLLEDNLNNYILNYIKENNISADKLVDSDINQYLEQQIEYEEFYKIGARIDGFYLLTITNVKEESSLHDIVLTSVGANKIDVIKLIREVTGLGLGESKAIADNGGIIKENVTVEEAKALKAKFEKAGATIKLK